MNREEARELLPWFAMGSLEPEESTLVAAHLEGSAELQAELAEVRSLGEVVNVAVASLPELRPQAMQDALRLIDSWEAEQPAPVRTKPTVPLGDQLREAFAAWFGGGGLRLAVAVQFALILALGGALLIPREASEPGSDPAFNVASGSAAVTAAAGGLAVNIVFNPAAREADVRGLLQELGGEIVAGPSATSVYGVRFDGESAELEALLATLRARNELVRFAAPAQ